MLTCALPCDDVINIAVPVVAQLRLPGKVVHVHDGVPYIQIDDVPRMHIQNDERVDLASEIRRERGSHHLGQISQLVRQASAQILHIHQAIGQYLTPHSSLWPAALHI